MYGVPDTLELPFLLDAELSQLCIGETHIQFNFSPNGSIGVEGDWELLDSSGEVIEESCSGPLVLTQKLIGKCVTDYIIDAPKSVSILFENGFTLIIFDSSEQYESFTIEPGGIIV